jgi:hypothetical protein
MLEKLSLVLGRARSRTWLMALMCVIALGASACQLSPSNSLTPTPTTLMGFLPPEGQSTEVPTQEVSTGVATAENGNSGETLDVCSLITQAEAEAVLGQTVININPGVDTNNAFGQDVNYCTFLGQGLAIVLSVADLGSPEAAKQALNLDLANAQSDSTVSSATQVSGVGDQAHLTIAEHAVAYTVATGRHVFQLVLGGNIGDPAEHQAALLSLAESVAGRL